MARKRVESLDAKPWLQSELTEWIEDPNFDDIEGVDLGEDAGERARMLRGLMLLLLPPASHGEARRWRAGYIRFVVMAWLHCSATSSKASSANRLLAAAKTSPLPFGCTAVALQQSRGGSMKLNILAFAGAALVSLTLPNAAHAQAAEARMERTPDRRADEGAGPYPKLVIRGATLIDGVSAIRLRYRVEDGQWQAGWAHNDATRLPRAVELVVRSDTHGLVRMVFPIGSEAR